MRSRADPSSTETSVLSPIIGIVDDDSSLLRALQRFLGAAGFTVETFESGEALLAVGQLDQISCLVLDIHLDGELTGFDLQERLATAHPRIPIIFITAHDDVFTRERARRTGAIACLTKPFRTETLLATINRALDQP
jgi:FixJ family two-component response regulator